MFFVHVLLLIIYPLTGMAEQTPYEEMYVQTTVVKSTNTPTDVGVPGQVPCGSHCNKEGPDCFGFMMTPGNVCLKVTNDGIKTTKNTALLAVETTNIWMKASHKLTPHFLYNSGQDLIDISLNLSISEQLDKPYFDLLPYDIKYCAGISLQKKAKHIMIDMESGDVFTNYFGDTAIHSGEIPNAPIGHKGGAYATIDDKLWIVAGVNNGNDKTKTSLLQDEKWMPSPTRTIATRNPCAAWLNSEISLVSGGSTAGIDGGYPTAHIYNWTSSEWTQVADMNVARTKHICQRVQLPNGNTVILAAGGRVGPGVEPTAEIFDLATNTWTMVPDMPDPLGQANAVTLGSKVYILGGSRLKKYQIFDHSTDTPTWESMPMLVTGTQRNCILPYNL